VAGKSCDKFNSKIAIKVNTANTSLPGPHWASVRAITDGLQAMDINCSRFPAANVTIFHGRIELPMEKMLDPVRMS